MAARDPGGRYYGVDYNPNQVRNARAFAQAAGTKNLTLIEESFHGLREADIPPCDIVVIHGIWSWIAREVQGHIVDFLRRKLKPGGLLYVSYNCAAGRSADIPLRRLLVAAERCVAGTGAARTAAAVEMVQRIADAGALYFQASPGPKARLADFKRHDAVYLTHEYLGETWECYFEDEVARALSDARLTFVGSTAMGRNRIDLALPREAHELLGQFESIEDQEAFKDIWANNTFRQDLFVKGVQRLSAAAVHRLIEPLRFSLTKLREDCTFKVRFPGGVAEVPAKPFEVLLDALAERPRTGAELAALLETPSGLASALQVLLATGYVALTPDASALPRVAEGLAGFDRAVAEMVDAGHACFFTSIPGLGTAVSLAPLDYYFWRFGRQRVENRPQEILRQLKATGRGFKHNDAVISDDREAEEILKTLEAAFDTKAGKIMQLGV
jgi:SAM-dependent methyltransferase